MDRRTEKEIQNDWDSFLARSKNIQCDVLVKIPVKFFAPLEASPEEVQKLIERYVRKSCYLQYEIVNIGIPK
jgi:hypothetical protein